MKKIGLIAVSAVTLCWAMYEVSSDNTSTTPRNESNQKVVSKSSSSTTKNEKLAPQTLLAQTTSLNSSAPVCKYNFDATQADIAFEMEFKIPTITLVNSGFENNAYMSSIYFTGVTNNGYTVRSSYGFDMGSYDPDFGENPPRLIYSVNYRLSDNSGPDHSYYKSQNMTNNTQEYQRLGIYINQNTRQVGFIVNGVDQGYKSTLPAPLENISFNVVSGLSIYSNQLFGQELSNELITDRNALQFNYPQGTTDMCGNAI